VISQQVGLALFTSLFCSQNNNDDCYFAVKAVVDDSQYGPCNQSSDTREGVQPYAQRQQMEAMQQQLATLQTQLAVGPYKCVVLHSKVVCYQI
jgi:hypothetical protein